MKIEDIIRITLEAHEGLKDFNGNPAIPHLRARGVEEDVLAAVDLLTHRDGMTYHDYVKNIVLSGNLTAMKVKLYDLHQNQQRARDTFRNEDFSGTAGAHKLWELLQIVQRHDWAVAYLEDAMRVRG